MKPQTRQQVATALRAAATVLARTTPADELAAQLAAAVKAVFPKSGVKAKFSQGSISLGFTLQGDKSKHTNNIMQNDPMFSYYWIHGLGEDGSLPEKITIDTDNGGSISVKPDPGSPLHYGRLKLGWRKKTATPEEIVKYVARYFANAKKLIKENVDRLKDFDSTGLL